MGFFSKLKKIVPIVDKGAAIAASVLPGKAGQVAGDVAQGAGVVTSVVQQIQSQSGSALTPEEAQQQATLATAVAVDDHEERMKILEAALAALQAGGSAQVGPTGQSSASGPTGPSGQSSQSGGQSVPTGPTGPTGPSGQS